MPTPDTLNRFIALVESNAHVEAIEQFYADHASMRENRRPPRVGKQGLIDNERAALAKASSVKSECVKPVFVEGDRVVIRWIFEFTYPDSTRLRLEELAWQRWENELIVEEEFFYDPAQLQRVPA